MHRGLGKTDVVGSLVCSDGKQRRGLRADMDALPVSETPPAGSEDYAFFLEKCKGSYLLLGNGTETGDGGCMAHNPAYDFNDRCLGTSASYWVRLTQAFLR